MNFWNIIKRKRERLQGCKKQETKEYVVSEKKIYNEIQKNINYIKNLLKDNDDIIYREFICLNTHVSIIYIDGLVNRELIDKQIVYPMMIESKKIDLGQNNKSIYDIIFYELLATADLKEDLNMKEAVLDLLSGETLLLVDGFNKIIRISTRGWANRGIQQPILENAIRGPRDSFNETVRFSTMLIRRRVRDTRLRIKNIKIGRRSQTDVYIVYIDDIVDRDVLEEVQKRLNSIDTDTILDSGMIEQFIEDNIICLFPTLQTTERPDEVVAAIYEGRIALLTDNSNTGVVLPATFMIYLQNAEDYYDRWHIATFIRLIRVFAVILTVSLPSLYISISSFNPALIPPELGLFIAATREGVPMPVFLEALFLEFMLELLREAGLRLPGPIGQTIGIVGALIIGQAAVQAGLISPIMVIIVAATAIASFAIPNYNMAIGFRLIKFLFIIASAILGIYGFLMVSFIFISNLAKMKSFGVPYLSPFVSFELADYKDSIIKMPIRFLWARPIFSSTRQKIRMIYIRNQQES
ncbi:spore germination protein [Caldicellulosiruptoraceae bacterium PP1]